MEGAPLAASHPWRCASGNAAALLRRGGAAVQKPAVAVGPDCLGGLAAVRLEQRLGCALHHAAADASDPRDT